MERGAPKTIDDSTWIRIGAIARCDPRALGQSFSVWSLTKLCDYLIAAGLVATISREPLRRILHEGGMSWQATKTWKASHDPECLPRCAGCWTCI